MRKFKFYLLMIFLFAVGTHYATAQDKRVVTGTVTDSIGKPIQGVTVSVKGGKALAATDDDGRFNVHLSPTQTILLFSAVGYASTERNVSEASKISVTLKIASAISDEVVVTGFGNRKKSQIGSATTVISGDDIRRTGAINPIAALQGLVPGMQVQPGLGGPQATPRFFVRGNASLDPYKNQPLIVIDNVIMDNQVVLQNTGGNQDFGDILKDINPDDIASITVLKGGAVTALYGSRAQNGVILITTKKGFSQKGIGVDVSQSTYFDIPWRTMDLQNQFGPGTTSSDLDFIKTSSGELQVDANKYGLNFGPQFDGRKVLDFDGREITYSAKPHNVLDLFRTGITNNTNVSVSGGSANGSFRLSYSRNTANGVTPNNSFNRQSITLRATQRLLDKILVDASATYVKSNALNPEDLGGGNVILSGPSTGQASALMALAAGMPRYFDVNYWKQHYLDPTVGGVNQNDQTGFAYFLYGLYQNQRTASDDNFNGNLNVRVPLVKGLEFQGTMGISYLSTDYQSKVRGTDTAFANPQYSTYTRHIFTGTYRGSLNYTTNIHNFNLLLQGGGEYGLTTSNEIDASMNGAILPDVYRLSNSINPPIVTQQAPKNKRLGSLFYQASIGYKTDVTLNVYGRGDWNSTLVYNDTHGKYIYFYPGVDLTWTFTQTFKDKLPSFFDYGNLRLSWVQVGNGTDPYTTNTGVYKAGGPITPYQGGSVINYWYGSNSLPNQNLVPERSNKLETGLEFKLFKNRLGGDISYYVQDTKNQIIPFGTPITSGVQSALLNGGEVRNKGIEMSIYGTPIRTKNFAWDTRINYTHNSNTILSLPFGLQYVSLGGGDGYQAIAQVKGDYGTIVAPYGYAKYQATDASGNPIASALNGKRVLFSPSGTSTLYARASDYVQGLNKNPIVGSILPKLLLNWRNTFTYKSLQLMVGLDSKFGGMIYSTTQDYASWTGNLKSTLSGRTTALGGVTYTDASGNTRNDGVILDGVYQQGTIVKGVKDGQNHDISGMTMQQAVDAGIIRPTSAYAYYANTHSWFRGIRESAMFTSSWVGVQQASITYALPQSIASKFKLNGLRAGVFGQDLFFLYNSAPNHINPYNLNSSSSGAVSQGSESPYIRRIGFTVNATF